MVPHRNSHHGRLQGGSEKQVAEWMAAYHRVTKAQNRNAATLRYDEARVGGCGGGAHPQRKGASNKEINVRQYCWTLVPRVSELARWER